MYILYGTWMCWSLIRMRSWQRSGKLASTEALLLEGKSPCWCCERSVQKGWINTLLNIASGTWSLFCHFYVVTWTWYPNLSIYVPGSRFGSPPNGTPPFSQLFPFACYLQHFRATTFHLQPMCSISEPYTSLQNISVLPMYYLHAVYILPIYYTRTHVFFPLVYDQ